MVMMIVIQSQVTTTAINGVLLLMVMSVAVSVMAVHTVIVVETAVVTG